MADRPGSLRLPVAHLDTFLDTVPPTPGGSSSSISMCTLPSSDGYRAGTQGQGCGKAILELAWGLLVPIRLSFLCDDASLPPGQASTVRIFWFLP